MYIGFLKHDSWRGLFETLKMFYPLKGIRSISSRGLIVFTHVLSPEGRCVAYPVGVQLFLLMFYFGLGRVYWTFKNQFGFLRFLNLENVLL